MQKAAQLGVPKSLTTSDRRAKLAYLLTHIKRRKELRVKLGSGSSHSDSFRMDITAPGVSPNSSNLGSRFQQLWREAEEARESNRLFEESLDALVVQVRNEIGPHEIEFGLALRRQLFKLISFSSRKSLLQWQRGILEEWIAESMSTLTHFGLVDDELLDHLAGVQAQALNIAIDENSEISVADQLADVLDGLAREFDDDFDLEPDDELCLPGWVDEESQASTAAEGGECDAAESRLQEHETLFKKLFHRTARALHPDKVADQKEQQVRQVLMARLLEARRNQDLMSVFDLYREYVDSDVDFSEQDCAELERILLRFSELQNQRRAELITQSHTHQIAYELFYSTNKATTNRKIRRHLKEIQGRIKELDNFSDSVGSLKALKPYLEARYDEMYDFFSVEHGKRW